MIREENIEEKTKQEEVNKIKTDFTINSSMGNLSVDLLEFERAKKNAKKMVNPPELSVIKIREKSSGFLGERNNLTIDGTSLN